MAALGFQVWSSVLLFIHCVIGAYVSEYALTDYCGRKLSFGIFTESIKLILPDSSLYNKKELLEGCDVHIKASFFTGERLFVQFLDSNIDCSNYVQLYDGSSSSDPKLGEQTCGNSARTSVRTTGSNLYIKFAVNNQHTNNEFTMLITEFHGGLCKTFEFQCNNGWCIDNDLFCNGYDNCGDNSDYCYRDWWIWVIVGIASFLIISVVITVICCCVCKRTRPGVVIKTNDQPAVHYQPGTNTVTTIPANPWYGAPVQYPPPQGTYPTGQAPLLSQTQPYTTAPGSSINPPPQPAGAEWASAPPAPPAYSEKVPY